MLRFEFPTPNRPEQLADTIAQLPETHTLIERWNDSWYVLGDRRLDAPWGMIEKMLDLDPLAGFYCLKRTEGKTELWHLGETIDHVKIWISSGAIASAPESDPTDDPETLEAIEQILQKHFGTVKNQ